VSFLALDTMLGEGDVTFSFRLAEIVFHGARDRSKDLAGHLLGLGSDGLTMMVFLARDITLAQLQVLWPALVVAVAGKSWEGKEKVLEAFVSFAVDAKQSLDGDEKRLKELEQVS